MHKNKTQQFSKFFIKDSKNKLPIYNGEKSEIGKLNFSSTN